MENIRLLIVDDSVVARSVIREALSKDSGVEVVGTALNGLQALEKIEECKPDIVTLDVEMPEMNGVEALKRIRARWPQLPVIMFSTLTDRGASTTLEALSLGASDYITKPVANDPTNLSTEHIRNELLPKLKSLCRHVGLATRRVLAGVSPLPVTRAASAHAPAQVVAIGVSTGGPNALNKLIPALPADFPVPILIVQHMPPIFTAHLAEQISKRSQIPVKEGLSGQPLEPGTVWIAPGGYHMVISGTPARPRIILNQGPLENSCRPAVDPLFRSVAQVYGKSALGVILTGMGSDGTQGCARIHASGGQILVQNSETSVVWGMPGSVANTGIADQILPLEEIAGELCRRVGMQLTTSVTAAVRESA